MPFSSNVFNHLIANIISVTQPQTLFDIGAGAGKYGKLARQVEGLRNFKIRTTAIEMDAQYIRDFDLPGIYDEVIQADATELHTQGARIKGDLCILGDFIEHLPKSRGIDLLNFLLYRFSIVLVAIPVDMYQEEWMGHAQEAHISLWYDKDFQEFKNSSVIHKMEDGGEYLLACLNGVCNPVTEVFTLITDQDNVLMGYPNRHLVRV